jgi:arginase
LAVKIVRQPKKIALIGACSSAAAFLAGTEKAPAALRSAGLVEKLKNAGFEVTDMGDCPVRMFADDEEHRRARNLPAIVAGLNDLKMQAEIAVKSGALVLVLGGDCAQVIGLLTGARRYYRHLNLFWLDRHADLNTPATTPSGRIDGMVMAHIAGRGAPELVRFWGEPPLVREPDVLLYGIDQLDPGEQEFLAKSPMRHVSAADIQAKGAAASARAALEHLHSETREFVLHLDVDAISEAEFPAVNVPGSGGLSFADVKETLRAAFGQKTLIGLDVAQYNPDRDADGSSARRLVDLLVDALSARLQAQETAAPVAGDAPVTSPASEEAVPEVSTDAAREEANRAAAEVTSEAPTEVAGEVAGDVSEEPAKDETAI